jgi:two-component system chemotaxis sensor kinase CheA
MTAMDAMAAVKQTFFQECEEQLARTREQACWRNRTRGTSEPDTDQRGVPRGAFDQGRRRRLQPRADLVRFAHTFSRPRSTIVRTGKLAPSRATCLKVMLTRRRSCWPISWLRRAKAAAADERAQRSAWCSELESVCGAGDRDSGSGQRGRDDG